MRRAESLRRFRAIIESLSAVDLAAPDCVDRLRRLKVRAQNALSIAPRHGNPTIEAAREEAVRARKEAAAEARARLRPIIAKLRKDGHDSYRSLAKALDAMGIKPARAERWTPNSVRQIEKFDLG